MNEIKKKAVLTKTDLSIGVAVMACLLVCQAAGALGLTLQALSACTAAIMCVQGSSQASWKAGMNRILGVLCGGVMGILVALADNALSNVWGFCLMVGLAAAANMVLCKIVKLPFIQAKVSCMTLLLVTLVLQGQGRIGYAVNRFWGTLAGAVVALLVSMAFAGPGKKAHGHD